MNHIHRPPYASSREDKLPPEIILSIEHILNLGHVKAGDPLDTLTNDFTPVSVLNEYFPDGMCSIQTATLLGHQLMPSQRHLSENWSLYRISSLDKNKTFRRR